MRLGQSVELSGLEDPPAHAYRRPMAGVGTQGHRRDGKCIHHFDDQICLAVCNASSHGIVFLKFEDEFTDIPSDSTGAIPGFSRKMDTYQEGTAGKGFEFRSALVWPAELAGIKGGGALTPKPFEESGALTPGSRP
ncbi:hypothetical protein [Embleya sp. NBC_00896]|uniref:hypothetical protein n=1 Tax=Embleya sp. NBC_00896 TaxID=2975961 RepID=UPI0038659393|nr:hypothetical protein OG928_48535 [Embleya sp. NBC_00896]